MTGDSKQHFDALNAGHHGCMTSPVGVDPAQLKRIMKQIISVPCDLLTDEDMRHLRRFAEICEDSDAGGHDLPKDAVKRLEKVGALRNCGFGRHETTAFGDALLTMPAVQSQGELSEWERLYHRLSGEMCQNGEALEVDAEDQCLPDILEAIENLKARHCPLSAKSVDLED